MERLRVAEGRGPPDMGGSCKYILNKLCGQPTSCGSPACGMGGGLTTLRRKNLPVKCYTGLRA
jgi:hypothetical protein